MDRVATNHSLHAAEKDIGPHTCHWRTIECDGETDVVECSKCGKQRTAPCNFDDDYS